MPKLRPSIRSRLLLVAALSAVLALLHAAQVGWRATHDRAFTASELSALPANRGRQAVIAAVQKHREAAARALVRQAVEVTERIAGGDLSRPVPEGRGDELSRVLAALGLMQDRLRDLLQRLQDSAGSIHVGSSDVARGART